MAAVSGALSGPQGVSGGWLTAAQENAVIGYPAQETYPGPITGNHEDPGPADPGRSGPPDGPVPPSPYQGLSPELADLSGGEAGDLVADLGHSAPMAAFDSSAGEAFAPSGPVADTHGYDTGGTERKEHVPVPKSPGWWRVALGGQTWNRQAQVTDDKGWHLSAVNDRRNLNQNQGQNADGYDPRVIPYSERPVLANFAHEAYPVGPSPSIYGVDGTLPDMAPFGGQGDFVYTQPADPSATLAPAVSGPAPQPALGMEFLSG